VTFRNITVSSLLTCPDAFLYDNIVETIRPVCAILNYFSLHPPANNMQSNGKDHEPTWKNSPHKTNPALGKKQIEAKMMLKLASTDAACTERLMRVWKEMLSTTVRDQNKHFGSLEEYIDFRIIDTGAP
jgi:hypothetical protein